MSIVVYSCQDVFYLLHFFILSGFSLSSVRTPSQSLQQVNTLVASSVIDNLCCVLYFLGWHCVRTKIE